MILFKQVATTHTAQNIPFAAIFIKKDYIKNISYKVNRHYKQLFDFF